MMKRAMIAASVILALASCTKGMEPVPGAEAFPEGSSTVTFRVEEDRTELTRATSESDATVGTAAGDIQILVFSGDGLIAYGRNGASSRTVSLSIRNGDVDCYAAINAPDLSGTATKGQLLGRTMQLTQNTTSKMLMVGSVSRSITASTTVQIAVKRLVAKVEIDRIDAAMAAPAHRATDLTVNDITLLNVAGSTDYTGAGGASPAYNVRKHVPSAADALTHDRVESKIQTGGRVTPHEVPHYFYCCPSTASGSTSTRLSIKATLGTTPYYYTVEIPQPEANTLYRITDLKITGPGSDDPNEIVEKSGISFTVTVTDWSTGFSKEVVY